MSDALGSAASTAGRAAKKNPLADVAQSEAADRLKSEVQDYLAAQATRLLTGVGTKLDETTGKLNDIAEGNSPGFAKLALDGGRKLAEGKSPVRAAFEVGAGKVKDNVVGAFKNLTGGGRGRKKGGGGQKPTVIIEYVDVGVPVRTAYDQWTQYQDFSTFAKGVKSANRGDDTSSDWQLKVFWSNRSWKAKTTEQVPDDRISWTSEGAKGTTKGVVSFHELADNLTRVVLVIEYYPKGLFEKTGNIWRAQGRRARLDLKNYVRHITFKGEADDGWRGEIRDGEVVRSHEDAVAEEDEEQQQEDQDQEDQDQEQAPEGEADSEYDDEEPEGEYDEEEPEGEYDEEEEEPEYEGEAAEYEDASREEYEDAGSGSRR
ncbi:SRPBCC family protein [Streptomyces olivaceus]|uniref:SRPBCC family protein n=1 Tax=Streptomyces olivaceus TaxID=47716 RepID=A0ABS7W8R6_STROV|nr:SRPBCC family protein [Streptomyces olivaceus]MBZ6091840.1 SRPBCC family protein [Streptomyces olivaceus]MBZ6098856.1 SRPBCC family protein [Streptomyces olivaceus]MBZ6118908.1 SRPBCC family protein [Streptomyces olivaceus]MBZ6154341.1 SRPBCC family protein [Streptomyces olivaceus]MBZ6300361.1 SRPBCC family protein [Streptomyces olivaceus]